MKIMMYALLMVAVFLISGCKIVPEDQYCISTEKARELGLIEEEAEELIEIVPIADIGEEVIVEEVEEVTEEEVTEEEVTEEETVEEVVEEELVEEELPTKTVNEGDLVNFPNLETVDADGDAITYTFTEPLNEDGEWQTEVGDAGEYVITISASDGKTEVSTDVKIIVLALNSPPAIEGFEDVTVDEGETVLFEPVVTDADDDEVTLSYSGWMTEAEYTTNYEDSGVYTVTLTASDGTRETTKEVTVTVLNVNRAPILTVSDAEVTEGDLVTADASATDADGDELTLTFGEPLNEDGEWQTEVGDVGTYDVTVTVSDGELTDERTFTLTVSSSNMAPDMGELADVELTLTDPEDTALIDLTVEVSDPEDDELTVTYSEWMTEATKVVTWDDAGEHTVIITVTDGTSSVEQVVLISINRAPQIII